MRAAIELADQHGLEGLSTRAIADRLGSGPTSMYWHVPTKADLYELMIDAVIGEIPLADSQAADWRQEMHDLARGTLAALQRHPWSPLLGIQPGLGPNTRRYTEFSLNVLLSAGLDIARGIGVLAIINNYTMGFALRWAAWEQLKHRSGVAGKWDEYVGHYLNQTDATDPVLASYVKSRITLTNNENFELGLDCLLDGIAQHLIDPTPAADRPADT